MFFPQIIAQGLTSFFLSKISTAYVVACVDFTLQ